MKDRFIAGALFVALAGGLALSVNCAPKALSQGTVEVNYSSGTSGSGCPFEADVDGSDAATLTYGQVYTLPDTFPPGGHTLHLSFVSGTSCDGVSCGFTNSSSHSVTYGFNAAAGEIFEANVLAASGSNCYQWTVSGS